jgi:hypothetical protein
MHTAVGEVLLVGVFSKFVHRLDRVEIKLKNEFNE